MSDMIDVDSLQPDEKEYIETLGSSSDIAPPIDKKASIDTFLEEIDTLHAIELDALCPSDRVESKKLGRKTLSYSAFKAQAKKLITSVRAELKTVPFKGKEW